MAKQWSKRMASSRRHKIDRKKREAKRDIRRAAKALAAAGQGKTRTKKSREVAKSALRIPKSSAQKEEVLNRLLVARQKYKETRAKKRLAQKGHEKGATAEHTRKRLRADGEPSDEDDDDDEEEVGEEEGDEEELEEEEEGSEEGADTSSEQHDERKAASQKASPTAVKRLLIPSNLAGNYGEQLVRFLNAAVFPSAAPATTSVTPIRSPAARLPIAFLVVVDARCPVQSCPWPEVDFILRQAARDVQSPVRPVKPLVLFALAKADLVSAHVMAAQYKLLSDALAERYNMEYASSTPDVAAATPTRGSAKNTKAKASAKASAAASASAVVELPVDFALCPFSPEIEGTTRQILRVLRKYEETLREGLESQAPSSTDGAHNIKAELPHNMYRKLGVLLLGLPKSGKTVLASALSSVGSDSSVAATQVCKLFVQAMRNPSGGAHSGDETTLRVLVPSPKAITVLTLPDHPGAVNKHTVLAGDIIFASEAVLDRLDAPEAVATLLLEQMSPSQLVEVAQNFSLAAPPQLLRHLQPAPTPATNTEGAAEGNGDSETEQACVALLKSLGRVIVRDRGFVPTAYSGVLDQGASGRGSAAVDPLTASSVKDAPITASYGRRIVRVWPQKTDGRNPLKVGARTLLQEFRRSRYLPWAVTQSPTGCALNVYNHPCIFTTRYFGKDADGPTTEAATHKGTSVAARNAESFRPGLQALQKALMSYIALLPRYCISIPASAIVSPMASIPGESDAGEQAAATPRTADADLSDE